MEYSLPIFPSSIIQFRRFASITDLDEMVLNRRINCILIIKSKSFEMSEKAIFFYVHEVVVYVSFLCVH